MNSYQEALSLQQESNGVVTIDDFRSFIQGKNWTFAKSMPRTPHEYIVKGKLAPDEQAMFEKIAQFIRDAGFNCKYFKAERQYYILDDFYYWTMGDPIPETIILNRAKLSQYEIKNGRWWVVKQ